MQFYASFRRFHRCFEEVCKRRVKSLLARRIPVHEHLLAAHIVPDHRLLTFPLTHFQADFRGGADLQLDNQFNGLAGDPLAGQVTFPAGPNSLRNVEDFRSFEE